MVKKKRKTRKKKDLWGTASSGFNSVGKNAKKQFKKRGKK